MEKNGKEVAYQWDLSPAWQKSLGLAGMGILVGALLFGSWNNPETTFAHNAESQGVQTLDPPHFQKGGFADIAKRVRQSKPTIFKGNVLYLCNSTPTIKINM